MNIPTLSISHSEFESQITDFLQRFEAIETESSEATILEGQKKFESLDRVVLAFLESNLTFAKNYFSSLFSSPGPIVVRNNDGSNKAKLEKLIARVEKKKWALNMIRKVLNACDYIKDHESVDIEVVNGLRTWELETLLLEKLFGLFDDEFYPLEVILYGNGVKKMRRNFYSEIASSLAEHELINFTYIQRDEKVREAQVQLTYKGRKVVEEFIDARNMLESNRRTIIRNSPTVKSQKDRWRSLLSKGNIERTRQELSEMLLNNSHKHKLLLQLSGRQFLLEDSNREGTISESGYHTQINQILKAFIELVEMIEDEDLLENPDS